ncbi:tRNA 2-thiocytidine(32) synthetase TtcA [Herbaspirillum seropedicae]|uniref:tRNA-cytidine(32) 2-sulfurtransferase n=1 Tax=Herbaspirillum seropedicae (strain SmR1) TaxID=757424 RepID=D8IVR6_HERSS|nr:tRNA 2-thiocytidine(32) synthetase TtcA [Herbaspirillum seropedicae]ADJ65874.1 ATPase of the PP-loop superfamily implicated in cell cycle control protein [Herbaspirillum seropedicae SmR1]MDR6397550.1 tRNA 2-thiocytidine biosynthesis protein TtcA [Herbaspirillum seropedicae]
MNDMAAAVPLSDPIQADELAQAGSGPAGQSEVTAPGSRRFELLQKNIRRLTGRAIADFDMIRDGDVIMACMSGGADSYTMLDTLRYLQSVAPVKFEIIAVNLDQKQPGFPEHILPEYFERIGVRYRIVEEDTYSIVKDKIAPGKTTCSLCSRLRRGILYRVAKELGATKIALGHHRDDILHTFMLNMFYGGKIKTMPPKLIADDGENVVIRPLAYVREPDIKKYAAAMQFPIIPCNLCGSQPNLQRQAMREMLNEWEKTNPLWIKSMFTAMGNIAPSHMLDRSLFDFTHFTPGPGKEASGDTLFDRDDKVEDGQSVINLL